MGTWVDGNRLVFEFTGDLAALLPFDSSFTCICKAAVGVPDEYKIRDAGGNFFPQFSETNGLPWVPKEAA